MALRQKAWVRRLWDNSRSIEASKTAGRVGGVERTEGEIAALDRVALLDAPKMETTKPM